MAVGDQAFGQGVFKIVSDDTELVKGLRKSEKITEDWAVRTSSSFGKIDLAAGRAGMSIGQMGRVGARAFALIDPGASRFLGILNQIIFIGGEATLVLSKFAAVVGGIAAVATSIAGAITAPFVGFDKAASTDILRFFTDWWEGANKAAAATRDATNKMLAAQGATRMAKLRAAGTELAKIDRTLTGAPDTAQFGERAGEVQTAQRHLAIVEKRRQLELEIANAKARDYQKALDADRQLTASRRAELDAIQERMFTRQKPDDFYARQKAERDWMENERRQRGMTEIDRVREEYARRRAPFESDLQREFSVSSGGQASSIRFARPSSSVGVEGRNTIERNTKDTVDLLKRLTQLEERTIAAIERRSGLNSGGMAP